MYDSKIREAADRLREANLVVVLTGAGVSKESGIPTYRDALDGLWAQYNPQDLATPQAFQSNPKLVWEWYEYRRKLMSNVRPNPGHCAIADLEDLVPNVTVVTQNIDGLHQAAGSSDVIELHGAIYRHKCFNNCRGNPTLIDLNSLEWDRNDAPPRCPHCGAYVRPDVVWFTEQLPQEAFARAGALSSQCNIMLIVGTSGVVQPAASMPYLAKRMAQAYVIDVNPQEDELASFADLFIKGPSGEVLPQIIQSMRAGR